MQLSCEVCRAPLRSEDVRLDLAMARCHSCNAVYDLSGRKAHGLTLPAQDRPRLVRARAPLPARFHLEAQAEAARITWRWFRPSHLFLMCFCLAWFGVLAWWYSVMLWKHAPFFVPLLLPLVGGVLGLTYYALVGLVNHTTIEVSRQQLTLRHGPLPWRRNRTLTGRQLTQIYGEKIVGRHSEDNTYDLNALDREDRKIQLLTELHNQEQALYLEQTLERLLGIEDAPVLGETAVRVHHP